MWKPSSNEITKINYQAGLNDLIELVKTADFVAIDCTVETTGFLLRDDEFNPAYMADVDKWNGSWYDNIKAKEKTHCLLEVGVAVFKRSPTQPQTLEAEAFHIPVLPACIDDNELARFRGRTSARLQFDGYGKDYIRRTDFDVNKVFYMATPYLNRNLEQQADEYMIKNPNFMVATRKRRLSRYLIPEIYEEVTEVERQLIISRLRGMARVFEVISQRGLPVIGHNLLLKLMWVYKDFVEYLPDTYPEYIDRLQKLFPLVYDTKQMVQCLKESGEHSQLGGTNPNLYQLIRYMSAARRNRSEGRYSVNLGDRSKLYTEDLEDLEEGMAVEEDKNGFCYQAGFDALLSGTLFLDLVSELSKVKCVYNYDPKPDTEEDGECLQVFLEGKATRVRNQVYLAPQLPQNMEDPTFLELLQAKIEFWSDKRKESEKRKKKPPPTKPVFKLFRENNSENKCP